jgi:uncharacterized membrane protein YccC
MGIVRRWWIRQPPDRHRRLKFWVVVWLVVLAIGLVRTQNYGSAAIFTAAIVVVAVVIEWAEAYAKRHPESRHHRRSN